MQQKTVVELLRQMQGNRTTKEFAKDLKVSAGFLFDIYRGNRAPGKRILDQMGIKKEVIYVKETR